MAASRYSVGIGPVPVPPALGGSSTTRSKPPASTRQRQPPSHRATTEFVCTDFRVGRPSPGEESDRPGVELEGTGAPGGQGGVEDVQRAEGPDPVDEVLLAEPVQGAHGEPAGVDRGALLEQRLDLPVAGQVAGEALGADGRVAAVPRGQQHAGAVQDDRHVEALADQAGRGEQVDQGHRTLERDRVDEDEGLLPGVGPDVLEELLLGVVQRIDAGLAARRANGDRHEASYSVVISWIHADAASWSTSSGGCPACAASAPNEPATAPPGRQERTPAARTPPRPAAAAAGRRRTWPPSSAAPRP